MNFINAYTAQFERAKHTFNSVVGSPEKILYKLVYTPDGVQSLEECGISNLYNDIQSHRESTDLAIILGNIDPMQANGLMSSYSFNDLLESEIIDVTSLPKNAGEMLHLVRAGQNLFDGLPIEIREEFNFSAEKFISEFGSKSFADKINALNERINRTDEPIYDVTKAGRIKHHVPETSVPETTEIKEVTSNESK